MQSLHLRTQSYLGAETQSRTKHEEVHPRDGGNLGEVTRLTTENRIKSLSHFDLNLKVLGDHSYKWSDILHGGWLVKSALHVEMSKVKLPSNALA